MMSHNYKYKYEYECKYEYKYGKRATGEQTEVSLKIRV